MVQLKPLHNAAPHSLTGAMSMGMPANVGSIYQLHIMAEVLRLSSQAHQSTGHGKRITNPADVQVLEFAKQTKSGQCVCTINMLLLLFVPCIVTGMF